MWRKELGASLNLNVDILPMDAPNRPQPRNGRDRTYLDALNYITVHETDNTRRGADADAHRRFLNNGGGTRRVSWHYTVDENKIWKHLRLNERGIHANAGNRQSVGIETCVDAGSDLNATRDRAARLVAVLLYDTGLPIDRVVQHNFWSGKNCPRRLRAGVLGVNWMDFINLVAGYLDLARKSVPKYLSEEVKEAEPDQVINDLQLDSIVREEGFEDDPHIGIPEELLSVDPEADLRV
ncbi:MAG: N-acetylmuramoyl-L-alanine amidase [Rhodobacter sp.]|nr:N-acetylmuramoyl-L-alanine amidase [Rhodobacter sp.]